MRRFVPVAIAIAAFVSAPAFAQPKPLLPTPVEKKPAKKGSFPMPAEQYQEMTDARIAKAKERMERATSKMSADQAKAVRAKFDSFLVGINAQIAKAVADGVVTKAEHERVNDAFSSGK